MVLPAGGGSQLANIYPTDCEMELKARAVNILRWYRAESIQSKMLDVYVLGSVLDVHLFYKELQWAHIRVSVDRFPKGNGNGIEMKSTDWGEEIAQGNKNLYFCMKIVHLIFLNV